MKKPSATAAAQSDSAVDTSKVLEPSVTPRFFPQPSRTDCESNLPKLLEYALNADLSNVKAILENVSSELCQQLLSGSGKATTHLGRELIDRTGTALQMAIYDHDEEMVEFFKEKMEPAEFQRQCEVVVGADYDAFLIKQKVDATLLYTRLEDAFKSALPNEFTVNKNGYVASTTSKQLPGIIDDFIKKLMDYVKNNPVHNPFILQRVYEIYTHMMPIHLERDCYFSQKVIGGMQLFLSARWLQHYAQGIHNLYLAENNEVPGRSFICRDSRNDIRDLVRSRIGSDSFLSINARESMGLEGLDMEMRSCAVWPFRCHWLSEPLVVMGLQKLCLSKTASLQNLMPRVQSTHSCVIQ
jgi:hypothetical protein